jgi:hypothetical protein
LRLRHARGGLAYAIISGVIPAAMAGTYSSSIPPAGCARALVRQIVANPIAAPTAVAHRH